MAFPAQARNILRFGAFELELRAGELRKSGLRIKLQQQPLQILQILVERSGEVVTREELRQRLWPAGTYVDFERSLNKAMVRLRDALGDSADFPRFIETLPRKGYRFLAPVEGGRTPDASAAGVTSIAVLPFLLLNALEQKESLSLGFADALITALGSQEDLIVPPTAAIMHYPAGSDPLEVSRNLEVRYVLQGNIQTIGVQWRVSIQVFDAQSRKIAFTQKYDFHLENVFDVQDQMAARVAELLQLRFSAPLPRSRDRYTQNPAAYDELMQALRDSSSDDRTARDRAIDLLSRSVERDPQFALAHAVLSYACAVKYFETDSNPQWLEKAESHCHRAIELDPELAEGHLARAYILWSPARNFDHLKAIAELQRALALQPNVQHAHNRLGTICAHIGRFNESRMFYERAHRLNPQSRAGHGVVQAYLWEGKLAEAQEEIDVWLKESPGYIYPVYYRPWPGLLAGNVDAAAVLVREALNRHPEDPIVVSLQGLVYAFRGERALAVDCVRKACAMPRSFGHSHHTYYQIAGIHSLLGESAEALAWLERAVNTGFPCWPFFSIDPALRNLHASPQFQTLVKTLQEKYSNLALG
ncbi:MAG TPA: winged helix-turn-helix domain-containing protein [Candidatus Angelobacter sp.]|nr:winged helix-turn-helix domain-containing protein [Candidatus Angelobacter sp.]